MTDFIRVRDKELGYRLSIAAVRFDKKIWDKVEGPAVDGRGDPLPPEYDTPKPAKKAAQPSTQSPASTSDKPGQSAASSKE